MKRPLRNVYTIKSKNALMHGIVFDGQSDFLEIHLSLNLSSFVSNSLIRAEVAEFSPDNRYISASFCSSYVNSHNNCCIL